MILKFLIKLYLKSRGVKIGKNFSCYSFPIIDTKLKNISLEIGDDVKIGKNVEFFFRNKGKIQIFSNVKIDNNVRLLAANNSKLVINQGTKVGKNSVINAGDDIYIGKKCLISGNCYIQSSSHTFEKNIDIIDQNHKHEKIIIENDVWVGANSSILMGVTIKRGTIVGTLTKIDKSTEEFSIYSGKPMIMIKKR